MSPPLAPLAQYAITQEIPVADHVYKFLVKRCGGDHITASRNTHIGSLAISLHSRNMDLRPSKKVFTRIFKITINESHYEKVGMHFSPANAQLFNDQIDKLFREELYCHVLFSKSIDRKLFLKSIKIFLDLYDIGEDDIKLDTLYRDFKRKKDELSENLNLTSTSGTKCATSQIVP